MIKLINQSSPHTENDRLQWIYLSMLFFHGITLEMGKISQYQTEVNDTSKMMVLYYQNMNYFIPMLTKREQLT